MVQITKHSLRNLKGFDIVNMEYEVKMLTDRRADRWSSSLYNPSMQ